MRAKTFELVQRHGHCEGSASNVLRSCEKASAARIAHVTSRQRKMLQQSRQKQEPADKRTVCSRAQPLLLASNLLLKIVCGPIEIGIQSLLTGKVRISDEINDDSLHLIRDFFRLIRNVGTCARSGKRVSP
eukprot:1928100-Pleurochrysis_carterae.AAC.2